MTSIALIKAWMLKISKSGRWIYTSTSSVQELLTELTMLLVYPNTTKISSGWYCCMCHWWQRDLPYLGGPAHGVWHVSVDDRYFSTSVCLWSYHHISGMGDDVPILGALVTRLEAMVYCCFWWCSYTSVWSDHHISPLQCIVSGIWDNFGDSGDAFWWSGHLVNIVIWSIWSSGQYGYLISLSSVHLVVWSSCQYGHLVIWSFGWNGHLVNMVIWSSGQYGHGVSWSYGHLVIWSSDHLIIWSSDHLIIRSSGHLVI